MLGTAAAREAFRDRVISYIGFVRSPSNVADRIAKFMSQVLTQKVIAIFHINIKVDNKSLDRSKSLEEAS